MSSISGSNFFASAKRRAMRYAFLDMRQAVRREAVSPLPPIRSGIGQIGAFFRLEFRAVRIRRMERKNMFEIKLASFLFLLAMFVVVLGVADHNRKVILSIDEPRQLKN